jgi:uncharacterized protein
MANPVVHFEITGRDPEALRRWFGELFAWEFAAPATVAAGISDPGTYAFTEAGGATGIPGGVGGGPSYTPGTVFYVAVDDVEAALARAEELGGRRLLGPAAAPSGLVVGHLADPEGTVIGVAALPG